VTFSGNENKTCVLFGFTIRDDGAYVGGGVFGDGTRATIENNMITRNSVDVYVGELHR
jgi:hypothetical protein